MAYIKCLRNVSASASVISVNLYSAAADTVSFTDASGARSVTTDSSGHASIEINIASGGSLITFTSSVAKNPNNLSEAYTKSINITGSTENINIMPDGALYWYGCIINWEEGSAANGWTGAYSSQTYLPSTWGTNYIDGTTTQYYNLIGNATPIAGSKVYKCIAYDFNQGDAGHPILNSKTSKPGANVEYINVTSLSAGLYALQSTTDQYVSLFNSAGNGGRLYAVWYE